MQHKAESRGATVPLVLGLVVVVILVLLFTRDRGTTEGNAHEPADPLTPSATGTGTPEPPVPPAQQIVQGSLLQRLPDVCVPNTVTTEITALSYNIQSGHGPGGLEALVAVMANSEADVILLQEVDERRRSSGRIDQPAWFAERLGMESVFAMNVDHGGGALYGTAVLSRFPIISAENTHLPNRPGMQRRGLAHVVIDVDGVEMSLYNTHLQHTSESMRIEQMSVAAGIIAADDRPRILGGDLNASPRTPVLARAFAVLSDSFTQAGGSGGATAPAHRPRGRIDYLLHAGEGIEAISADVLPAVASDHRAVRTTYRLSGQVGKICVPGGTKPPAQATIRTEGE